MWQHIIGCMYKKVLHRRCTTIKLFTFSVLKTDKLKTFFENTFVKLEYQSGRKTRNGVRENAV
jgi:hypothetical protein